LRLLPMTQVRNIEASEEETEVTSPSPHYFLRQRMGEAGK